MFAFDTFPPERERLSALAKSDPIALQDAFNTSRAFLDACVANDLEEALAVVGNAESYEEFLQYHVIQGYYACISHCDYKMFEEVFIKHGFPVWEFPEIPHALCEICTKANFDRVRKILKKLFTGKSTSEFGSAANDDNPNVKSTGSNVGLKAASPLETIGEDAAVVDGVNVNADSTKSAKMVQFEAELEQNPLESIFSHVLPPHERINIDHPRRKDGFTPLCIAVLRGVLPLSIVLMEDFRASTMVLTNKGYTPYILNLKGLENDKKSKLMKFKMSDATAETDGASVGGADLTSEEKPSKSTTDTTNGDASENGDSDLNSAEEDEGLLFDADLVTLRAKFSTKEKLLGDVYQPKITGFTIAEPELSNTEKERQKEGRMLLKNRFDWMGVPKTGPDVLKRLRANNQEKFQFKAETEKPKYTNWSGSAAA